MTNHRDIILRNGDIKAVSTSLNEPYDNVAGWKRNNSIPPTYWLAFKDANLATLEELAQAVAKDPIS